jgi:hypothetical protein
MKKIELNALDRVEILTLQDNTIDITMMDNNAIVQRAMAIMYMENAMPGQFILNMSGTKLTFAA